MDTKSLLQNQSTRMTIKLILIFILTFFLLIPQVLILDLINDRQDINQQVTKEVASDWAGEQLVTGPVLVIPYYFKDENGKLNFNVKDNLIIFPDNLDINGDLNTHTKYRSLYKVLLYGTQLKISGKFTLPDLSEINLTPEMLDYNEAFIGTGISDMKGIKSKIDTKWNGQNIKVSPGLNNIIFKYAYNTSSEDYYTYSQDHAQNSVRTGFSSKVVIDPTKTEYTFTYDIDLNGSQSLLFSPIAKNTKVEVKSLFPDPSFTGDFLPEHVTNGQGFDAKWTILEYNKNLPPYQKANNTIDVGTNIFGVKIAEAIDNYSKAYRAGKYMILFVILTFLVVFLTETVQKVNIHVFQYGLVGLALAIFFTLLLSISEFWGYDFAYIVSAAATIGLIFLYSLGMFHHRKSSILLASLLIALFAYIYIIIQLEKTALLVGSVGLFVILAATMYITRKIKWFEDEAKTE
ncbi:MAG: cell envelope integrity protein CreD [Saprospiraceae bacterium]